MQNPNLFGIEAVKPAHGLDFLGEFSHFLTYPFSRDEFLDIIKELVAFVK
jgi:hypothetical protein